MPFFLDLPAIFHIFSGAFTHVLFWLMRFACVRRRFARPSTFHSHIHLNWFHRQHRHHHHHHRHFNSRDYLKFTSRSTCELKKKPSTSTSMQLRRIRASFYFRIPLHVVPFIFKSRKNSKRNGMCSCNQDIDTFLYSWKSVLNEVVLL